MKTYNIYWLLCTIDLKTGDFHLKKEWMPEKIFKKSEMDKMIKEWRNINRIHKPLPVLLYTDWKAWKINNWNCYLTSN